jgi:hypothetical protein
VDKYELCYASCKEYSCNLQGRCREKEIDRLKAKVAELEKKASLQSWKDNPDRMGGSFTQEEIDNATTWR